MVSDNSSLRGERSKEVMLFHSLSKLYAYDDEDDDDDDADVAPAAGHDDAGAQAPQTLNR